MDYKPLEIYKISIKVPDDESKLFFKWTWDLYTNKGLLSESFYNKKDLIESLREVLNFTK